MSPTHGSRWLEREDVGEVIVVRLKTKALDHDIVRAVFDTIGGYLEEANRRNLVLNLAAAESLGTLALCRLLKLNRKLQAAHGRLVLCQLSDTVRAILESTLLTRIFAIRSLEQEALRSCA